MAGDTDRRPFRASNSEMGSKPGGTESVLCKEKVSMQSINMWLLWLFYCGVLWLSLMAYYTVTFYKDIFIWRTATMTKVWLVLWHTLLVYFFMTLLWHFLWNTMTFFTAFFIYLPLSDKPGILIGAGTCSGIPIQRLQFGDWNGSAVVISLKQLASVSFLLLFSR